MAVNFAGENDVGRVSDPADFDALYSTFAGRAMKLAGLLCGHRERAEDAVAEAFVLVLPRWQAGVVVEFWPYLRTAVVNQLRGLARRDDTAERWRQRSQLTEPMTSTDAVVVERDHVAQLLRELPERQRLAVVLRFFEDLSEIDTAAVMGCSVGTVKSATSRGVARLREVLDTEEER